MIFIVITIVLVVATTDSDADNGTDVPLGILLLAAALPLIYEVWMVAAKGQTLGKMALHIKVVRADNGDLPGMNSSFMRWILPGVFGVANTFVPGLGIISLIIYLSLLWGKNKQGWHDMAAKTLVIKT